MLVLGIGGSVPAAYVSDTLDPTWAGLLRWIRGGPKLCEVSRRAWNAMTVVGR
jgi:hypothetical protein